MNGHCMVDTLHQSIHHITRTFNKYRSINRSIDSTMMNNAALRLIVSLLSLSATMAFVPVSQTFRLTKAVPAQSTISFLPPAVQRERRSVANVQTMGLFGLGAPEIAIILVAAAFLLGPQKLAELGKDAGKIAGELKEVPKEFQKGLAEGEKSANVLKGKEDSKAESNSSSSA